MKLLFQSSLGRAHVASAMSSILGHDETLLYFLFSHKRLGLRDTPSELLEEAKSTFSDEDFILLQWAIALWDGEGQMKFSDILKVLDDDRLLNWIRGILKYREIGDERRDFLLDYPC